MDRDDLCYESTVSLARRIRAGEVSPLDAVDAYLERIDRVDPRVHSYLHVAADHALQSARRAEEALARGVERRPAARGSRGGEGPVRHRRHADDLRIAAHPRWQRAPRERATAVERLEQAGAVLLGKLHMTEFAFIAHHPDTPHREQPVGVGPLAWWFVQRLGRRDGVRARERDARKRHGGVDPVACRLVRRRRPQAHVGAGVAGRRLPAGGVVRPCGSDRAQRRGRGAAAPLYRRSGSPRPVDAPTRGAACGASAARRFHRACASGGTRTT